MCHVFRNSTLLALGFCLIAPVALLAEDKKEAPPLLKAPFTENEAKEAQDAWAKHLGRKVEEEVDLGGGVKLVLLLIPPGMYTMGSPKDEKDRNVYKEIINEDFDAEKQHTVTITKPFYLGKYAVTQEQYEKVVGRNPSWFKADGDGKAKVKDLDTLQFPVETVSWEDADGFCQKAGKKLVWGKLVLPSEAQWEYACRAGTQTPFHFGDVNNGNKANCCGDAPYGTKKKGPYLERTCEVRAYTANAFGLYQMHGNVYQWCADYYGPYEGLPEKDPLQLNEGKGKRRVFRGGSWVYDCRHCRAATRFRSDSGDAGFNVGFRVCVRLD
jgi:formylglycine-generating enzyme required for sulfatase activity